MIGGEDIYLPGLKKVALESIAKEIKACTACGLCKDRKNTVPGEGNPQANIVFCAEAPGATEDELGRPFVGRAGKLLDNMIKSIGLAREDVFISNVCRCRPPGNRKPTPQEMNACLPFLKGQLNIIRPKVIVALGSTAIEGLCGPGLGISKRRGKWEKFNSIPVMPTFHPAYLLRNSKMKDVVWYDLQEARKKLEVEINGK